MSVGLDLGFSLLAIAAIVTLVLPERHREAVERYVRDLEARDVRDVRGDLDERDELRN